MHQNDDVTRHVPDEVAEEVPPAADHALHVIERTAERPQKDMTVTNYPSPRSFTKKSCPGVRTHAKLGKLL